MRVRSRNKDVSVLHLEECSLVCVCVTMVIQEEWAVSPSAPAMDGVLYPDDFANEPPRAPSHHYQPVPPIIPPSRPQV